MLFNPQHVIERKEGDEEILEEKKKRTNTWWLYMLIKIYQSTFTKRDETTHRSGLRFSYFLKLMLKKYLNLNIDWNNIVIKMSSQSK